MSLTPDTGYLLNTTLNITMKIIVMIEIIKTFRMPTPAKRSILFHSLILSVANTGLLFPIL